MIASGTVPGGCLLEHVDTDDPAAFTGWLQAGDVVSLRSPVLGSTRQLVCPSPAPVLPYEAGAAARTGLLDAGVVHGLASGVTLLSLLGDSGKGVLCFVASERGLGDFC